MRARTGPFILLWIFVSPFPFYAVTGGQPERPSTYHPRKPVSAVKTSGPAFRTNITAGDVSGTWTIKRSPYNISGEITIPNDSTLTIEPGVEVVFMGHYKFNVQGRLLAIGTEADTIRFTAQDTDSGWHGIRFINTPHTNDTSKMIYCSFTHGKANTGDYASLDRCGGAIMINGFSRVLVSNCLFDSNMTSGDVTATGGPGVCIFRASPRITNSTFVNNTGDDGSAGAIKCDFASEAVISNNIIANNTSVCGAILCAYDSLNRPRVSGNTIFNNVATYGGGGIFIYGGSHARIENNVIHHNQAPFGAGIVCTDAGNPVLINNTIVYNNAESGGGIFCDGSGNPIFVNNIVWGNAGGQIICQPPVLSRFFYNNIQDGAQEDGNIRADPLFADSSFRLSDSSECIGLGIDSVQIDGFWIHAPALDFDGSVRPAPAGSRPDLGAREHPLDIGVTVPPVRITPSSLDFQNVFAGSVSDTLHIDVQNLGVTPRTITSLSLGRSEFQFSPMPSLPLSLAPVSTASLRIAFMPTVPGMIVRDTLIVGTSDLLLPGAPVFLSGRGSGAIQGARSGVLYGIAASSSTVRLFEIDKTTGRANLTARISPRPPPDLCAFTIRRCDATLYAAFPSEGGTALCRLGPEFGDFEPSGRIPVGGITSMAFSESNRLYIVTSSGKLYRADDAGMDTVFVGSTQYAFTGLAFSPATGVLWASLHDTLFTVDTVSGTATMVGSSGGDLRRSSIAFNSLGVMYGLYGTVLMTIGKVWGEPTGIGETGVPELMAIAMRCDVVTEADEGTNLPGLTWQLEQNYPNPFNPTTNIRYQVPAPGGVQGPGANEVKLAVYDLLGREVAVLVDERKPAGNFEATFDGAKLSSGVYIYRLIAGSFVQSRRMILMK